MRCQLSFSWTALTPFGIERPDVARERAETCHENVRKARFLIETRLV